MKIFTNKKIWQKIVIIFLILLLSKFMFSMPVHAAVDGDILLDPVTKLFVSLGDAIMSLMQDIMLQQGGEGGESLIKIDGDSGFWSAILVAAVFILGTAVAIIAAIPTGGASTLAWFGFGATALLTVAVSGTIACISFNTLTTIVADQFGDTYYLPMYEITPYEIFANKVLLFDINFFNPGQDIVDTKIKYNQNLTENDYDIGYNVIAYDESGEEKENSSNGKLFGWNTSPSSFTFSNCTPEIIAQAVLKSIDKEGQQPDSITPEATYENGEKKQEFIIENTYSKLEDGRYTGHVGTLQTYNFKYGKCKVVVKYYTWYYNGWISRTQKEDGSVNQIENESKQQSTAKQLQSTIASWYIALRNISLVALLSVLVYIGIRITLSSVANEKAKYKTMMVDWIVALCLVFLMHYIMSFSVTIVSKVTDAVGAISLKNEESKENINKAVETIKKSTGDSGLVEKLGDAVELIIIDASSGKGEDRVKNAWKVLVKDQGDDANNQYRYFFFTDTSLQTNATDENNAKVLIWPAYNFMEQARMRLQLVRGDGDNTPKYISYGYAIIFVVLVIYTLIFAFTYLRRVVYMAFLTIIAPLVAVTYPIDKISDGKAQAFNTWLREYIFNLLIQPLHLILYLILIGSALSFAAKNIFYVVLALGFFMPAEKLLRSFFGFQKAQTPGMFGGAAGSALLFSGLQRLMHPKPPTGKLGSGHKEEGEEETPKKAPWRDKSFDDEDNLVNTGDSAPQLNRANTTEDDRLRYDSRLNQDQRDELQENGIEPGSQEYNQYLREHGIIGNDTNMTNANNSNETHSTEQDNNSQLNIPQNNIRTTNIPDSNDINNTERTRKRSKRRAIGHGIGSYGKGMRKQLHQRYKAKGSLGRRTIRMAAGVAGATALGAAGGLIGITSGDATKAAQYMSAGIAGGYKVGTAGMERLNQGVQVKGSFKEAEKAYYGDDYKKVEQEKFKKQFKKDEENLRKIEDKLKVERKKAKEIMNNYAEYYLDRDIDNIDDIIATYRLETEGNMSRDQAIATTHYATQVMNNEDTRTMTAKRKKEYRDTFIPKFAAKNSRNPEADVDTLFSNIDKFHKYRK